MKRQQRTTPSDVDEYLANVPGDMRAALQQLRRTIHAAAPEAEEVVSYRIPAFRQHGMLVYYGAFKDHCSFFVGSIATLRKFARELKPFTAGRGTLQFTPQRPIPEALVKRIVRERIAENKSRSSVRNRQAKQPSKRVKRASPTSRS
jgi:uncharacterized protein YdhG (YjbR/CyaY superfamily)